MPRNGSYGYPFNYHSKKEPIDDFKNVHVLNWGPQETTPGLTPNPQPDGSAGIWIQISDGTKLGDVEVILDDQTAKGTVFNHRDLITASISAESFKKPGEKNLYFKQINSGTLFLVGKFKVMSS